MKSAAVALVLALLLLHPGSGDPWPSAAAVQGPAPAQAPPSPVPSPVPSPAPSPVPSPPPSPPFPPPGQQPQPPVSPELRLIVPARGIGGILIGQPLRAVIRRLGAPTETRPAGEMTLYIFPRFGIAVYAAGDVVRAVLTTSSVFRTRDGLGVGSSVDAVKEIYGPRFVNQTIEGTQAVAYDQLGIAFGAMRQTVVVVLVYKPSNPDQP